MGWMQAAAAVVAIGSAIAGVAWQGRPDPAPLLAAQRKALAHFERLDGEWRGAAWTLLPDGKRHELTQTERVGPMLDGTLRVIEGRGYEADGTVSFNAFAVLAFDGESKRLSMRSFANGRSGDFAVTPTEDGFSWEIPAGPGVMRYTAVVEGDSWHEVGDFVAPGRPPVRSFEMTLARLRDCSWPAGGAVAPTD